VRPRNDQEGVHTVEQVKLALRCADDCSPCHVLRAWLDIPLSEKVGVTGSWLKGHVADGAEPAALV
jgi:hypothetical protein